jgi:hypothetical protein
MIFNTILALVIMGIFLGIIFFVSVYILGKKTGKKEEQSLQNESIVNEVLNVKKDTVNRRVISRDNIITWMRKQGFVRKE